MITPSTPAQITPAAIASVSTHTVPVPDESNPHESLDSEISPSTPTSGHWSAAVCAALSTAYTQLEDTLTNTVEQILDGWHKNYGRMVNGINYWNCYASYLTKNDEQER
ncbi:hypothetical protein JVU11DRAFT_10657 [Chiua virens]|nr:hypothetical protein JVU11DRAFT_10657 [Chiua virens]